MSPVFGSTVPELLVPQASAVQFAMNVGTGAVLPGGIDDRQRRHRERRRHAPHVPDRQHHGERPGSGEGLDRHRTGAGRAVAEVPRVRQRRWRSRRSTSGRRRCRRSARTRRSPIATGGRFAGWVTVMLVTICGTLTKPCWSVARVGHRVHARRDDRRGVREVRPEAAGAVQERGPVARRGARERAGRAHVLAEAVDDADLDPGDLLVVVRPAADHDDALGEASRR